MNQPGAMLQLGKRVAEQLLIDALADLLQLLHRRLPVRREDLGCQATPCRGRYLVVVGRENTELIEEFGRGTVVAARILKVAKVVELIHLVERDLQEDVSTHVSSQWKASGSGGATYTVILLQEFQVSHLVASEVAHNLLGSQRSLILVVLLLVLLKLVQDLLLFSLNSAGGSSRPSMSQYRSMT